MREVAGAKSHLPVIVARDQRIEVRPVAAIHRTRRRHRLHLHRRLRRNFHQCVSAGDIKMMHCVPREVAVLHDVRRRIHVEC